MLPIEWEEKKLEDVCNFYLGLTYTPKYVDSGVPFLSVKDITKGYLSFEKTRYIAREEFENSTSNAKPQRGDIIFGRVGTLGQPLIVETDIEFCIFVSLGLMRVFDNLHNVFLKQWMTSDYFTKQVDSKVIGSAQKNLNIGWLRNFKILLPSLKEQEKIADILSTTDAKIDAIASQIEKAETLKKGLLQKLLSEGIGHSEFKDSEIGKIPASWEVGKLSDLGKIITGSTPKTSNQDFYINGTRLWASPSDLGKSKEIKNTNTKLSDLGFEQIRVLEERSILITCIGSTIGKMGIAYEEMSSNQQINAITCNQYNNPDFYYYALLQIQDKIKKLAGTQAVPLLNKTDFSQIKIIKAPLKEQKQIADILSTADKKLEVLRAKKQMYDTLKKGLLQKLLSGEVRI